MVPNSGFHGLPWTLVRAPLRVSGACCDGAALLRRESAVCVPPARLHLQHTGPGHWHDPEILLKRSIQV